MQNNTLKEKTITSIFWAAFQRFGTITVSFVGNLFLARLLTAEDYGLVGMLTVFISLSETFIDSGLGSALIQKKNPSELDYSTVFWSNIFISFFCYLLLFSFAPLIADFFQMQLLGPILRIKGFVLIIQGFRIIQTTRFQQELNFKKLSIIYFTSTLVSTVISIIIAYLEYGVWALVFKTLLDCSLRTILLWLAGKWKPQLKFSWNSFKSLFSFGGVMLITSLVITLYQNIQSLIIGKAFSAKQLGYYTQAAKLEDVPATAMEQVVNQVAFSVFSKIKDDFEKIQKGFEKILICLSYISFPLMVYFLICAKPIFNFLFTDKWNASIPYFRILCILGMIVPINVVNTNLLKASGEKKEYFNLQVSKRIVGIIFLILSLKFGIYGFLITRVIIEYYFFIVNGIKTKKVIGYTIKQQIKNCFPSYFLSIFSGVIVFFIFNNIQLSNFLLILLEALLYFAIYIFFSFLFRFKAFCIYKDILVSKIRMK